MSFGIIEPILVILAAQASAAHSGYIEYSLCECQWEWGMRAEAYAASRTTLLHMTGLNKT